MIFQHTYQLILEGRKTQTRRIATGDPPRWAIARTYAVQPGRGKKSVARIRVVEISKERLGDISEADVRAEGFRNKAEFIAM